MPEVIAYYIANSYYRNAMYEGSFLQHYNSAKDLINMFGENEEKVKKEKYIEYFFPVKIKDFNIMQFEQWKRDINKAGIPLRYKNDIYKFLRSILNFGVKWHGFNFNNVYNKMTMFQDPNERRKEMSYYNYEEFKKFISYEDDLRWKCVFEIFYYCGLRKGELKGLTWKDIYFDKKVLSVNKQITQLNNRTKFEFSDTKIKVVVREKDVGVGEIVFEEIYKPSK